MTPLKMQSENASVHETPQAVLGRVRVASPCMESWEAMPGGARVRACERCRHKVYNLSEMTADEAARLVQEAEGRLCVRFYQRPDGTVMTKDCPVGLRAVRLRLAGAWSAALASVSVLLGFFIPGKAKVEPVGNVPTTATPLPMLPTVIDEPRATMGEMMIEPPKATMGMVAPTARMGQVAVSPQSSEH